MALEPRPAKTHRFPLRMTMQVLGPLPHHMPRASGFDCVPTYVIIGGLVFVPLCCPMFDYKEHKHLSQQLYNLVSASTPPCGCFCASRRCLSLLPSLPCDLRRRSRTR